MKYKFNIDQKIKLAGPELILPNIISLRGDVTEEVATGFIDAIIEAQNNEHEFIPIMIDSYGGDVYALYAMIDILKTCTVPIITCICGKAMSAGAVLFSCGTEGYRYISPSSTIMIHHARQESGSDGRPHEMRIATNELERMNEKTLELFAANCGKPKTYFKDLLSNNKHGDLYLDAKEAKKHNIANHIKIPEMIVDVGLKYSIK